MSKVYGLVLAGGQSRRMGKDKAQLSYHGQPHSHYLYKLLSGICDNVFLSIRDEQKAQYAHDFNLIIDKDEFRGPFNGLLSAHDQFPEVAWLVVACDLPLVDEASLTQLIEQREVNRTATAFATLESGLPEPLIAIWEPGALKAAKSYLIESESSCPRKYLINSDTKVIHPNDDKVLLNANVEEDYKKVLKILSTV